MKRLKIFVIIISILLPALLVGCTKKDISVGKYYMENNTESYIEILENNEILFVNVDFSELEDSLNTYGSSLSVADVANKFSQPQKYDYYKGSSIDGYNFTIQVLLDENTAVGELCLTLRWSNKNALLCLNTIYSKLN